MTKFELVILWYRIKKVVVLNFFIQYTCFFLHNTHIYFFNFFIFSFFQ